MQKKDKGLKTCPMKKLAGMPISAFVAYSKKRKTSENTLLSHKAKKKRTRLADILPTSCSAQATTTMGVATVPKPHSLKRKKKKHQRQKKPGGGVGLEQSKKPTKEKTPKKRQDAQSTEVHVASNGCDAGPPDSQNTEIEATVTSPPSTPSKKQEKSQTTNGVGGKDGDSEIGLDTSIPKCLSNDPVEEAKSLFQWLIHPVPVEKFFKNNWERAPLQIKRSKASYYKLLLSSTMLDSILRNFHILYTKNIDITSYTYGQRETHNPPGRALPSVVWDYYSNGCSIRMLNPQTFVPKLHALNATLQEFFGCFVGANSYLTPPDSQGFAPHYDDIEAFILQIEGKKRWRLYKPPTDAEYLPRYSSKNFDPSEIGEPILDTVVHAGDLLYFPRGTIHQGETIDGTHSLHVTLSVYQKNSWCDFLEKLLPETLKNATKADSRFREGLPIDYLRHVGYVHSSKNNEAREAFLEKTKELMHRMIDHIDIDGIADLMAKDNVHDFLPPVLAPKEQECSVLKDGERMNAAGMIENRVDIEPDTRIRLLRSHCIRLVEEEDSMKIYYSTENSKEYHEYEAQFLEVEKELAPAVRKIIQRYPDFVKVDDLPIAGEDNRVQVARDLWEKCIVVTDLPLPIVDD